MKKLIAFILLCGSVHAADTGIKVVSITNTDDETKRASTKDVFTRDGKTILVRQSETKAGELIVRIHQFYQDDSLVGTFTVGPNSSGFVIQAGTPYSVSLEFGNASSIKSVVIASKDGVIVDAFKYENGLFTPVENSVLQKANAFSADMKQLFDPEHVRKTAPERFGEEAVELVRKHREK